MTDDDLRAALRAIHATDDPPPFRTPHARPARAGLALAAFAAVAVVGTAIAYLAWPSSSDAPPSPAVAHEGSYAIPEIASPTDFLLATPGAELLGSTPSFGEDPDVMKGTSP
jgi:hypothetical protein